MGWKNVKDHFQIGHIVCVTEKGICIGSGYVHDLAVINSHGVVHENQAFGGFLREKYPALLCITPNQMLHLINAPDTFEKSLAVYTYDGGEILEKQCEEYGYPNVTHDGWLMYEDTFFQDKSAAIEKAIESAGYRINSSSDRIEELESRLIEVRARLAKSQAHLVTLTALQQRD